MLSGVLRSKTAIEVNIRIMRALTAMRSFLMSNVHMFKRLETIEHHQLLMQKHLSEHDKKIEEVLKTHAHIMKAMNYAAMFLTYKNIKKY